jgi:tryptophan synthase alpha chain
MHGLVDSGADLIEIGVPFSDPMADGPIVQAACERALAHGVSLKDVLDMVREFRRNDAETPRVLMGYLNPIEAMGAARFAEAAGEAGVDGVITVDLPADEPETLLPALRSAGIDPIFLAAPTTTRERLERIAATASGFIYYVSLKGVTGSSELDLEHVARKLDEVRRCSELPLGVGFGIATPESAAAVARVADAVVVGSALVRRIGEHATEPERGRAEGMRLIASMREAMDAR